MAEGERVLIVDDEGGIRELLFECLRQEGCQVQGAATGSEAERALSDSDFGVVVLDLNLPDVDGTELLGRIRQDEDSPEVIVLSGQASLESALAAIEHGACAYLQKPFDIDELLAAVRRALAKAGRARERRHLLEELRARGYEPALEARPAGGEKDLERIRSEFITAAAHQLRTPLTSVHGYVELLLSGAAGQLDDRQRGYLEAVQRNCQRLEKVVGTVLDLVRIESGALEVELEPVDVSKVVRAAVAAAAAQAKAAGVELELVCDPEGLIIASDPARLGQVVEELIGNALHHTPRGGSISVETRRRDHGARIVVTDTGVGVPTDAQGRLFEVFFRVEGSQVRDAEGAGLGLAIAHAIVRALGGALEVESTLGRGSTFTISLPGRPSGGDEHGSAK